MVRQIFIIGAARERCFSSGGNLWRISTREVYMTIDNVDI